MHCPLVVMNKVSDTITIIQVLTFDSATAEPKIVRYSHNSLHDAIKLSQVKSKVGVGGLKPSKLESTRMSLFEDMTLGVNILEIRYNARGSSRDI